MKLREFLKNKSRADFAAKVGTTKGYIDQLCAGNRRPRPELADKIERASGGMVTFNELLRPTKAA